MRNILICPISAIIKEIPTSTAYYILCSSSIRKDLTPNALLLCFLDTVDERSPYAFRPEQARRILGFFLSVPSDADVFVCCEGGESRSAAVAAALKRFQGESDAEIRNDWSYHPNRLVYDVCCEVFGLSGNG